jgi:hypothetical protein
MKSIVSALLIMLSVCASAQSIFYYGQGVASRTAVNKSISNLINRGSSKKIVVSTLNGATILVDGKPIAGGSTQISVPYNSTVNVRVEKMGFITQERQYIYNQQSRDLPKKDFIKMEEDDAFKSSSTTDIANRDIDIRTVRNEDETWKVMSQIIASHFDILEVTDKTTGYIRTAWVTKTFRSSTIRTRLVIKLGGTNPLTYKAKLISEIAPSKTATKDDDAFKQWDRLLRIYEPILTELQSRLLK